MNKLFLKKLITKDTQLCTLPTNFSYLLKGLTEDNLTHQQTAEIIKNYPSIAARLLFLANSSWVAPLVPIVTLEMACAKLGSSMVKSVSIALCVSQPFSATKCENFDSVRFWSTALLVADGSAWLSCEIPNLSEQDIKIIHTSGLLHNIGLLWMVNSCARKTSQALERSKHDHLISTFDSLREIVGIDFCEVGEILADAWGLPDILAAVIAHHRNIDYQNVHAQYIIPVGYVSKMVSALYKGSTKPPELVGTDLQIDSTVLKTVYSRMSDKFEEYQVLAKLLFTYP